MSSPGSIEGDGLYQTPIGRIPTPLGPTFVSEEQKEKETYQYVSINASCQTAEGTQPASCQPGVSCNLGDHGDEQNEKETKVPFTKEQIITLSAICFANICSATFYSLLAPFFPTEALKKGATNTEVGIILGVFQGIVFITSPIFGKYMTVFGARFMFISGTLVTSFCVILFGLLQWCPPGTIYVVMCLAVRSVEALAAASTTTSSRAIAAHTFSSRLSTVMGILQACGCIGLMIGPPIGGSLYAVGGFYLPFAVSGGLFFISGIACIFMLPSNKVERKEQSGSHLELLKIPIINVIGYMVAAGQLAMGYIDVALAIHLQDIGNLHPAIVGLVFLIAPVVVVILAPIVGWITDKIKVSSVMEVTHLWSVQRISNLGGFFQWMNQPIMVVGALIGGAGFLTIGPSPVLPFLPSKQLWLVIVGLCVTGFGWSSTVVCYPEYIKAAHKRGFPDSMETQGLVSGVFNAYNSLGALIGPTFGGFLLQRYKFQWSSTMVAGVIILSGILLIIHRVIETICCRGSAEDTRPLVREEEEEEVAR